MYSQLKRERLWDKFYTDAPARQRQSVESQVKQLRAVGAEQVFKETASGTKIDRTSKFVYAELHAQATRMMAQAFLEKLAKIVPYKIHTILTDNAIQFAGRAGTEAYGTIPCDRSVTRLALTIV